MFVHSVQHSIDCPPERKLCISQPQTLELGHGIILFYNLIFALSEWKITVRHLHRSQLLQNRNGVPSLHQLTGAKWNHIFFNSQNDMTSSFSLQALDPLNGLLGIRGTSGSLSCTCSLSLASFYCHCLIASAALVGRPLWWTQSLLFWRRLEGH